MSEPEFDGENSDTESMFDFLQEDAANKPARPKKTTKAGESPLPVIRKPVPVTRLEGNTNNVSVAPPTISESDNEFDFLVDEQRRDQLANAEFNDWHTAHQSDYEVDEETQPRSRRVWLIAGLAVASIVVGVGHFAYQQFMPGQTLLTDSENVTEKPAAEQTRTADVADSLGSSSNPVTGTAIAGADAKPLSMRFREELATIEAIVANGQLDKAEQALASMDRSVFGYGAPEFTDLQARIAGLRDGSVQPLNAAETVAVATVAQQAAADLQAREQQRLIAEQQAAARQAQLEQQALEQQAAIRKAQQAAAEAKTIAKAEAEKKVQEAQAQAQAAAAAAARSEAEQERQLRVEEQQQAEIQAERARAAARAAAQQRAEALAAQQSNDTAVVGPAVTPAIQGISDADVAAAQVVEAQRQAELQAEKAAAQQTAERQAALRAAQQRRAEQQQATDRQIALQRQAAQRVAEEQKLADQAEANEKSAAQAQAAVDAQAAAQTQAEAQAAAEVKKQQAREELLLARVEPQPITDSDLQQVYKRFINLEAAIKSKDIETIIGLTQPSGARVQQFLQIFENSDAIDARIANVATRNADAAIIGKLKINSLVRLDGTVVNVPDNLKTITLTSIRGPQGWSLIDW